MIKRIGLSGREEQLAGALSGGWKQRLALGACTLPNPQLLLLDEPTAGVDPKARRDFWNEIHGLAGQGLTVLVSTHYMDEAERCHEIAYIAYGNLLAHGTVDEVIGSNVLHDGGTDGGGDAGTPICPGTGADCNPVCGSQLCHIGCTGLRNCVTQC